MKFTSFSRLLRKNSPSGTLARRARRHRRARPALENLEDRTLPSSLPITVQSQVDISNLKAFQFPPSPSTREPSQESTPAVAVDPLNPQHAVVAYVVNDPTLVPTVLQRVWLEAQVTFNGGVTWVPFVGSPTRGGGVPVIDNLPDPVTINPTTLQFTPYTQATNPNVAIGRDGNVYLLYSERTADNADGALILQVFDTSLNRVLQDQVVYQWEASHDQAWNPTMALDTNVGFFKDPTTNAVQNDPFAGNIYVAWNSFNAVPAAPLDINFNPNTIRLVVSSDHGHTFSGQLTLNDGINYGTDRDGQPQLTIQQGTADGRIAGGHVVAVWSNFGSTKAPGSIVSSSMPGGGAAVFSNTPANPTINDATQGAPVTISQMSKPGIPVAPNGTTTDTQKITIAASSITKLTVSLDITFPIDGDLELYLDHTNPDGTPGGTALLALNRGFTGSDYSGTTFDDLSTTRIVDGTPPFTGTFRTDGFDSTVHPPFGVNNFNGGNPNGNWTLRIKNDGGRGGRLESLFRDWTLTITATPSVMVSTDFVIPVNIATPQFTTLSNLQVTLSSTHPNYSQVELDLISPTGKTVVLFDHRLDSLGNTRGPATRPFGITGVSLGFLNFLIPSLTDYGVTFDDQAPRAITDPTAGNPFLNNYSPEGPTTGASQGLSQFLGMTAGQLNGNWTLRFTDFVNGPAGGAPAGLLYHWSLRFTSGLHAPTANRDVAAALLGAFNDVYPLTSTASPDTGIGPNPVIASDSTLGSFSPHQGRLYVAYVSGPFGTPLPPGMLADSTAIFVKYSDDGGLNWRRANAGFVDPLGIYDFGTDGMKVNDDVGGDSFSEGNRPHMQPSIAVDQTTGTIVVGFYDARYDPARSRVVYEVTASEDGGQTFSKNVYTDYSQQATDAITGQSEVFEPIPENQGTGAGTRDTVFGFGPHQGLAVGGGRVYPVWSGNRNGMYDLTSGTFRELDIYTAPSVISAGPRVVASTMGPVQPTLVTRLSDGQPINFNNTRAADGTLQFTGFTVTFDRPMDPNSFTSGQVSVIYRNPNTGGDQPGTPITIGQVVPIVDPTRMLVDQQKFGPTSFLVLLATPQSGTGTYSYAVGPQVRDRIRSEIDVVQAPLTTHIYTSGLVNLPVPAGQPGDTGGPNSPPVDSTINVNNVPGFEALGHISVTVTINHTSDRDLVLTLIAPDGTQVLLAREDGGSGANYAATVFDDSASQSITQGSAPFPGVYRPLSPLTVLNGRNPNGIWTLRIQDIFQDNVGTLVSWGMTMQTGSLGVMDLTGNAMDQNANGIAGEVNDQYTAPGSTSGVPFTLPFDLTTLPIVVPGPHVISTSVPGAPASADNLVLNRSNNSIDVVFDRDMQAGSFTAAQVLRVYGPAGLVPGPYTVTPNPGGTDPDPNFPRTYRISFPLLAGSANGNLSGTYTVQFGPNIKAKNGDLMDQNQNAGVDNLRTTSPTAATTPVVFNSANVPVSIVPHKAVTSTITVADNFVIQGLTVTLNIAHPHDPDLIASLIGPDGTSVRLFTHVGNSGANQGFVGTVFDDAATTPIQLGLPPFNGPFNPQTPLSALRGKGAAGVYTLKIQDDTDNNFGTLQSWSLTFQKSVPGSGLGAGAEDTDTVSFRLFTMDVNNPLSHSQWTAVGPASVNNGHSAGSITGLAVDPSDPSGNTVYVGGATGGVWKTTNFLTSDSNGPTYLPLTDFGPTSGLTVGSIAVFARNHDPNQSIVFAVTGSGDSLERGVGVLRSMDGGASWTLLDSSTNVDSTGKPLPISSSLRDHTFVGLTAYKVLVDPTPAPTGDVIVYVAFTRPDLTTSNGGVWRSTDSGKHWQQMRAGNATDLILVADSATAPTNNQQILFAGFRGEGVYLSPNQGATWQLLAGGVGDPLIRDVNFVGNPPVPVAPPTTTPTGAGGRIVLAAPSLTGNPVVDKQYEGWLYAAVATAGTFNGTLTGLYLTKDFGQNWTRIRLPVEIPTFNGDQLAAFSSNDRTHPDFDPTNAPQGNNANYALSLAIDPTNPNVVYLGGTNDNFQLQPAGGLIRIDASRVWDPHNLIAFSAQQSDGGILQSTSIGPMTLLNTTPITGTPAFPFYGIGDIIGGNFVLRDIQTPTLNLLRDPNNPFLTNASILVDNIKGFTNDGGGVTWKGFSQFVSGTSDQHRVLSLVDPVTGHARLIFADDFGIFTGVDDGNGNLLSGVGTLGSPSVTRNGNLQISQFFYGAAQPSNLAAQVAGALLYGNGRRNGQPQSDPNILTDGNLNWTSSRGIGVSGSGTASDPTGTGTQFTYQNPFDLTANFPSPVSDFFQVTLPGAKPIGRTFGLLQTDNDPQWPFPSRSENFAVNPVSANELIITSSAGRIFRSEDQGVTWFVIGDPTQLDSTPAPALAFGAPEPGGNGNFDDFIYAGTDGGKIFVTFTGGGGGANGWIDLSAGLDGSPVESIVADPLRGSHDAYAVTQAGVYHMANSRAANASWQNITGSLFQLKHNPFGDPSLAETSLRMLTSIAADWRFAIPDNPAAPHALLHPVLYVAGGAGVYRSKDVGVTWKPFPDVTEDGASGEGGFLPNVLINDLDISLGNINPTTGQPDQSGGPVLLVATTFGRGTYAIRLPNNLAPGPRVVGFSPTSSTGPVSSVTVTFNQSVDPSTFTLASIDVFRGPGGNITATSVTDVDSMSHKSFVIAFPTQSAFGTYTLTLGPNIRDFSGDAMDQDQNGINGEPTDTFTGHLVIGLKTAVPEFVVGADAGGGPEVKVFNALTGAKLFDFYAYSPFYTGGVHVALGDVNGDGVPDIVVGPGLHSGPDVRVFDGLTGVLIREFYAYDPSFAGGVSVAVADVNGDGFGDIITGAGPGGGPHVKVFSGKDNSLLYSFMAYDPHFTGGVQVAAGDLNGDGFADIVTGAGPGGGPHVKVFSGKDLTQLESFMAYSPTFTGGVNIGLSDVNGDGRPDIITGPGFGGAPQVKVFDGVSAKLIESFFAFDPRFLGGVRVGGLGDANNDNGADLIVGAGPGGGPQVSVIDGSSTQAVLDSFYAFDPHFTGGVFVGGL